ncbi:MAG: hypothetical protein WCK34_17900, partial [Bacteroidota bacterium]
AEFDPDAAAIERLLRPSEEVRAPRQVGKNDSGKNKSDNSQDGKQRPKDSFYIHYKEVLIFLKG